MRLLLRMMDPNDPASVEAAIADTAAVTPEGVSGFREYLEDTASNGRLLGLRMEGERFPMTDEVQGSGRVPGPPARRRVRSRARRGARAPSDGTRPDQDSRRPAKKKEEKAMAKRIALKDSSRSTPSTCPTSPAASSSQSEHERVDVSGFNATGSNEYLAGQTEQSVTVEFYGSYGATEVHATLYPIHADREVVRVRVAARPDRRRLAPPTRSSRATSSCSPTTRPRPAARRKRSRRRSSPPTRPGSRTSPPHRTWPARRSPSRSDVADPRLQNARPTPSTPRVRQTLRKSATSSNTTPQTFFSPISARPRPGSAPGFGRSGIAVEQRSRKTTGGHPEYGALQMRSLMPALHRP